MRSFISTLERADSFSIVQDNFKGHKGSVHLLLPGSVRDPNPSSTPYASCLKRSSYTPLSSAASQTKSIMLPSRRMAFGDGLSRWDSERSLSDSSKGDKAPTPKTRRVSVKDKLVLVDVIQAHREPVCRASSHPMHRCRQIPYKPLPLTRVPLENDLAETCDYIDSMLNEFDLSDE